MALGLPKSLLFQVPSIDREADRHDGHARKLERVVAQLRAHTAARPGTPVSFKKKAVAHQVPKRNDKRHTDHKIDVSDLDEILEIDPIRMTCTAEPGITFDALVDATLAHGLVPTVVPELKTITVGGAVAGCSLESMSFVYGGFHDSCLEYEVVTAKGEILRCTPNNEHSLVFQMIHGSFGTLGVLTKLKFGLVPAKPYVKMTYETHRTLAEYKASIHRHFVDRDVDFMDGIIHSPDKWVLSLGELVDEAPYTNAYDWTKVYYQSTAKRKEDYLRTKDYFFRYDRGVTNVHPKSFLGRLLLGKVMDSDRLLRIARTLRKVVLPKNAEDDNVTLDMFIPFSKLEDFFAWYRDSIDFFPLWCVPYRRVRDYEWVDPSVFGSLDDELFVDIAIYGCKQAPGRNYYREIEEALARMNSLKTLISYNYYSPEEFWHTFNKPNYDAVKAITDPDNLFRDLYTKTVLAARGL
jgi:FAD/FMN-containing dehydrogenase